MPSEVTRLIGSCRCHESGGNTCRTMSGRIGGPGPGSGGAGGSRVPEPTIRNEQSRCYDDLEAFHLGSMHMGFARFQVELLAMLMAKLGVNTEIVVVGENRSGVKSIEKMFKEYGPEKPLAPT